MASFSKLNSQPFYKKRFDFITFNGCFPKKFQSSVLVLLHEGHPGMTHIKLLARFYVWWPSINSDIEQTVQACTNCAMMARDPARVPLHSWDFSKK